MNSTNLTSSTTCITQPTNRSVCRPPTNQLTNQPTNQPTDRSVGHPPTNQPTNHPTNPPTDWWATPPLHAGILLSARTLYKKQHDEAAALRRQALQAEAAAAKAAKDAREAEAAAVKLAAAEEAIAQRAMAAAAQAKKDEDQNSNASQVGWRCAGREPRTSRRVQGMSHKEQGMGRRG